MKPGTITTEIGLRYRRLAIIATQTCLIPAAYYLVFSTAPVSADGSYMWMGGTSMAAPHVAGAAGLVIDENPNLSPNQVKAILKRTADKLGDRQIYGSGMLNVEEAVRVAGKKK